MRKILAFLVSCFLTANVFAAWDSSTDMQGLTVSAAFTQVQNCLQAIDGTTGTVPTNVNTKNIQLDGATSGTVTLTPVAVAGTNTITVPAATGTMVTTAGANADVNIGAYTFTAQTINGNGLTASKIVATDASKNLSSASGVLLPSGAVFTMVTGSCPTGTTNVSATYSNKFVRINATAGSTGGSDTDSITLTTNEMPAHTHTITGYDTASNGDYIRSATNTNPQAGTTTSSSGSGAAFSVDTVPAYVTMIACQVD